MSHLAVITPNIGIRSETFIRRQVQDLYPDRVVVVAYHRKQRGQETWDVSCPTRRAVDLSFELIKYGRYLERLVPRWASRAYYRRQIFDWLVTQDVTTILGQYLHKSWPFLELAKDYGMRFFAHAHGYDLSRFWQQPLWQKRYADFRHADGVIVVNQVMKQRLMAVGVPVELIHVVPYGVDVPEVEPFRAPRAQCRLLAVGRMVGKKAPLKTLEAFRRAHKAHAELSLDFVGAGPLLAQAREFVRLNKLNSVVRLHGGQPHEYVLDLMKESDLFIQHSMVDPVTCDEEGVPVAILEAMANGLPVVSTRHAGIPEAVQHGVNGLLVDEGDVPAMADAVIHLASNRDLRSEMGARGWKVACQHFTWSSERQRLREILAL